MIFRPFHDFAHGCAAYVLGCGGEGLGMVVDPRLDEVDAYVAFAEAKGLRLTHVVETHVHADHRSGARLLAERTGASIGLHASADVGYAFAPLADEQELVLGNVRVRVLHTPGHTPESVCLAVTDLRRGPDPWFLLTGDTLFVGSVGRPDLPGRAAENAALLHASLHEKVLAFADDVEIYPAHFSGSACGAGLSGKPSSTVGFEKRWSPLLRATREEFVRAVVDVPEKPAGMEEIVRENRGLGVLW
jgi:hydroxyacylglutathione hydrolase